VTLPPARNVTVIDHGARNTGAVIRALQRVGAEVDSTADLDRVASARRLVLPGVEPFAPAMDRMLETGLESALRAAVKRGALVLGLGLGFQLLFDESEDGGLRKGLGLLHGRIGPFPANVRVPHVGWDQLAVRRTEGIARDVPDGSWVYFVHAWRVEGADASDVAATSRHGGEFPAVVQRGNVAGCQFQPEKSSENGRALLTSFLSQEVS
jgi:imidazole glycerol-phosphate synthase subunit HisH